MADEFAIKPATRVGVKPLIGMYGKSGSGKTMSALMLMRGLIGPKGRMVLVDSEGGRGSIFADIPAIGGYSVIDLEPPFSPARYQAAFEAAESGSDGIVFDSLSHEHSGSGGMLEMQEIELDRMAGQDWKKREACKMAAWIKPKQEHKRFIGRLLRCKLPLICCLRGEEKTHIQKGQNGEKGKVITDEFSTPIFDQRFSFELLILLETVCRNGQGGYTIPRKITHPTVAPLLPREGEQIGVKTGEAIAAWCLGPSTPSAGEPSKKPTAELARLKKELVAVTVSIHGGDMAKLQQFLWDACLMDPDQSMGDLTESLLKAVIENTKVKLTKQTN